MCDTPLGYQLICNTEFPWCTKQLDYCILAPIKCGDWVPEFSWTLKRMKVLKDQLISTQQAVKWRMRAVQGSF